MGVDDVIGETRGPTHLPCEVNDQLVKRFHYLEREREIMTIFKMKRCAYQKECVDFCWNPPTHEWTKKRRKEDAGGYKTREEARWKSEAKRHTSRWPCYRSWTHKQRWKQRALCFCFLWKWIDRDSPLQESGNSKATVSKLKRISLFFFCFCLSNIDYLYYLYYLSIPILSDVLSSSIIIFICFIYTCENQLKEERLLIRKIWCGTLSKSCFPLTVLIN